MHKDNIEILNASEVEVDVSGRRFTLREHSLEDTGRFVAAIQRAVTNQEAGWLRGASGQELYSRVAEDSDLALALILQKPVDGKAVESEFIAALTSSQREQLINLQTDLDSLNEADYAARIVAVMGLMQRPDPPKDDQKREETLWSAAKRLLKRD